ncbi:MAG TPA: hypothetical protein VFR81_10725 [Longimicrobium sp.]|nr:hypothetical protein [Longimicrobium sp.]
MIRPRLSFGLLLSFSVSTVACAPARASRGTTDAGDGAADGAGAEGRRLVGATGMARWQDGKTGAVSPTVDDGIRPRITQTLSPMGRIR